MRTMRTLRALPALRKGWAAGLLAVVLAGGVQAQDLPEGSEMARRAIHVCAACHGDKGRSTTPGVPSLAAQMPQYVIRQLKDFRDQTRSEAGTQAYMWGVSALLDDATITTLADYYATLPPPAPASARAASAAVLKLGRKVYAEGDEARGIRDCASCHGDAGEGAAAFPRLAGQRADYLQAQIQLFSTRLRPHGVLMKKETRLMTPAEVRAVSVYLQSLK